MSYYVTTWEDVEDYADELPPFDDEWEEFVAKVEDFTNYDFEGFYKSKKFYEDIHFDYEIKNYIKTLESIKNKCDDYIKRLQKTIDDYYIHIGRK